MRHVLPASLILAALTTACVPSDDAVDDVDAADTELTGGLAYNVTTQLDLRSTLPPAASKVINELLAASDNPGQWVMNKATEGNTLFNKTIFSALRDAAAETINDSIPATARTRLTLSATLLRDALEKSMLRSRLVVATPQASHVAEDLTFSLAGKTLGPYALELKGQALPAARLTVSAPTSGKLMLAQHTVTLTYATMVHVALERAVLPMLDARYTDLTTAIRLMLNCDQMDKDMTKELGFDTSGFCLGAVTYIVKKLDAQINAIPGNLSLSVRGDATVTADGIAGTWDGTLSVANRSLPFTQLPFRAFAAQ